MNDSTQQYPNQRLGLTLFAIYLAMYLGFMLLCALAPTVMEQRPVAGLNLAILYGFGLIIAALVMALIYGLFCRPDAKPSAAAEESQTDHEGDLV